MSMKKATSTRSVMVEGFGLDQCGGKSFELARTTIPSLRIIIIEKL
jgi:hypothetical protein